MPLVEGHRVAALRGEDAHEVVADGEGDDEDAAGVGEPGQGNLGGDGGGGGALPAAGAAGSPPSEWYCGSKEP